MADVFVSYKAEDRARIRPLVSALEAAGLSVWWDALIGAGEHWRETIEAELDAARCVVVAWSRRSVAPEGRFVRDEATRAQRRGVYLPIRLDDAQPPLGFGEVQAIDLSRWHGNAEDPAFRAVVAGVRAILTGERAPLAFAPPAPRIARRTLIVGGAAVAALGVAGGGWLLWSRRPATGPDRIAVIPFANLSGDPAQAYFSDGIAEELRGALSSIPGIEVIGGVSSQAVASLTPREMARKLDAGHLLTGSLRRSATLIRVTAQLIEGASGIEQWSDSYDRAPGDAIALESGIAASVAQALSLRFGAEAAAALEAGGTRSAEAHDLYLRGQTLARSSNSEAVSREALALAEAALAVDPDYYRAIILRTMLTISAGLYFSHDAASSRASLAEAAGFARRAIAIAPDLPPAYAALGRALTAQLRFRAALAVYRKAQALGADAALLRAYSEFLAGIGHATEAVPMARQAVALDRLNPNAYQNEAYVLFLARRHREAATVARRAQRLAPELYYAFYYEASERLAAGDPAGALAAIRRMPDDEQNRLAVEAIATFRLGQVAESDRILARLRERWSDAVNYQIAQVLAQRGENDLAIATLQQALASWDPGLHSLPADTYFDPIRTDPRFRAIVARLDYP